MGSSSGGRSHGIGGGSGKGANNIVLSAVLCQRVDRLGQSHWLESRFTRRPCPPLYARMTINKVEQRKALAAEVIRLEAAAIERLESRLDEGFSVAVDMILSSKGQLVVTGMGKAGLVGQKISATMASTGTPSFY
ncbi:MAG: hypothetical protein ACI8X5_003437, partial [Planctomycetota bacterium]